MPDTDLQTRLSKMRSYFSSGAARSPEWRRAQLSALAGMGQRYEAEIFEALRQDFGKPAFEAFATETSFVTHGAKHALKHLRRWMRPRRVAADLANLPARARVVPEPLGLALIIAPWNYPYQLALAPLVGALAAGNCAVIKPSELAPATSALLARIVPECLDANAVQVIEGAVDTSKALLEEPFDHIFFTGSTKVGSAVMQAAGKHLTPVTLELGGKSPVILRKSADLDVAARRIAWGKCLNAGQTCIAPDYILAEQGVAEPFIQAFESQLRRFYGTDPQQSPDYPRIINTHHFDRLVRLLQDGNIRVGGLHDRDNRYIAPTVIYQPALDTALMRDEIFGPILPVFEVEDLDTAIAFINARPKPLALYLFSTDSADEKKLVAETSSGSLVVNDVLMQTTPPDLPFGGVGASGMGAYHGRASFDTFSHLKPVLRKYNRGEPPLRYAPYTAGKFRWLRRFL
ncbi:aldehyde dehydrogenase family protein [Alisedimentitalea sp. MJ-SS2]|uniref:aldehyde dehydrogenase family protein n=1 Tax=Aliisedimentitalea sp. MJ-SS2 TaxID=3049795 RepID=UPI00290B90A5|nr:aldehyde dehydrogenase family protein [Alisedimentitalea sp. MJ-SS2]MDU8926011.1 aldehyde dehydrogenase family protein [Alisedimentitalea sp. MJ-SS2]